MFIALKLLILNKKLLAALIGFAGLLLAFGVSVAAAQAAAVPNIIEIVVSAQVVSEGAVPGCLTTTPYQVPVSQASFLKYEKTVCSEQNNARNKETVARKINVLLTAYSSSVRETDSTPFITANGSYVHDGVIANNMLPFGTKVKIPALYGDKIFLVEDRMHSRKSDYQFDIWFPTHQQAKQFGVRYAYLEVLK